MSTVTPVESSEASRIRVLEAALVQAVDCIRVWHNMGVPVTQCSELWDLYWRNAPEMKPIREALSTSGEPLMDNATFECPYCDKPLADERAACCGEVGHARERAAAFDLALESPHELMIRQSGLGRECVMVRLTHNPVTPYATYELAGADQHGRRYCVRGEYLYTEMQAIHSLGCRTGTNLECK